jgi:uncharacterized membrane protein
MTSKQKGRPPMHDDNRTQTAAQRRIIRFAFGAMALGSVLVGLGVWQFADMIGLEEDTARLIATAFLAAGIGDALVLHFWDRLFKDKV